MKRAVTVLVLIGTAALLAPWIAPFDPAAQLDIVALKNSAPSLAHPFGTDAYSRDVLSRALFGARTSLTVSLLATIVATAVGCAWGLLAASVTPRVGAMLMSGVDVLRSVPRLLLYLGAIVLLGTIQSVGLALLLGLSAWTGTSHLVYHRTREVQGRPFVEGARSLGMSQWRVLTRHVLPHLAGPLSASGALLLADLLALEAGLSFIGIGVRAPDASWGSMVQDALPYLRSAWWLAAVPCVLLVTTVLCAARVADHLARLPQSSDHVVAGSRRHS